MHKLLIIHSQTNKANTRVLASPINRWYYSIKQRTHSVLPVSRLSQTPMCTLRGCSSTSLSHCWRLLSASRPRLSNYPAFARRHVSSSYPVGLGGFPSAGGLYKMADPKGRKQATLGYVRDSQLTIGCVVSGDWLWTGSTLRLMVGF